MSQERYNYSSVTRTAVTGPATSQADATGSEFQQFAALTAKLVAVSKAELDAKRAEG